MPVVYEQKELKLQHDSAEIEALVVRLRENVNAGGISREPGLTYEDGIAAALDWLFGSTEVHPYPAYPED